MSNETWVIQSESLAAAYCAMLRLVSKLSQSGTCWTKLSVSYDSFTSIFLFPPIRTNTVHHLAPVLCLTSVSHLEFFFRVCMSVCPNLLSPLRPVPLLWLFWNTLPTSLSFLGPCRKVCLSCPSGTEKELGSWVHSGFHPRSMPPGSVS